MDKARSERSIIADITAVNMFRRGVLASFGASGAEIDELFALSADAPDLSIITAHLKIPFEDEPFAVDWIRYAEDTISFSVFNCLQEKFVELSFPIKEGLSWNSNYLGAVNNGFPAEMMAEATGLCLNEPEALELIIHETLAGRIPVIVVRNREDFVALIQALTLKNEPELVPASQGALLVTGYRKRDSFIILNDGPYSGVDGNMMGLSPAEWSAVSLSIRLEHESTHYFAKRLFLSMRKKIVDELIADYAGIVAAWGNFSSRRLLHFMGLENFPLYRKGGRLENYMASSVLSGNAFKILQAVVAKAAENLESFDAWAFTRLE